MSRQRRIPASRSQAFTAWKYPAVGEGKVLKVDSVGSSRRIPAGAAQAEAAPHTPLEEELIADIRAGRYAGGLSARELESIVREAVREGYRDGFEEGLEKGRREGSERGIEEGLAAGKDVIDDAAGRLSSLIAGLEAPLASQQADLERALLELVLRISRAVVRRELALQPEGISAVVAEAVASLPAGAEHVRVFLCEKDIDVLRASAEGAARDWELSLDDSLRPGDCRVESGASLVSYTVSERFRVLVEQLLGEEQHGRPTESP